MKLVKVAAAAAILAASTSANAWWGDDNDSRWNNDWNNNMYNDAYGSGYGDDHMWLTVSIPSYVKETGDIRFLEQEVPFVGGEKGTIFEHMERAINFSITHLGPHDLPKIYFADWNDCLNLTHDKEKAESVMIAQMVVNGARELAKMAKLINKNEEI